jgi:hypothetical protein
MMWTQHLWPWLCSIHPKQSLKRPLKFKNRKTPLFTIMFPITFQPRNIVEKNKCSYNVFCHLGNVFFNYKPTKSTSTSRKWHSSWKCQPCVNNTTITITYHFSCKLHTIIIVNLFQLLSISQWTSFVN